jgi:hypothetical protein
MFARLLPVATFFFMALTASAAPEGRPELFFPLEQNHVKILPQRFEYELIDKDRFRVGDVLINAREIGFQLIPVDAHKNRYKIRFQWPAGLLQQGEIAIKDNSGKALWIKSIDSHQIQLRSPRDLPGPGAHLRSQLATYESTGDVFEVLTQLKQVPFFRFCIHREEPLTRIYLCSKDLYIKADDSQFRILARDSYRPSSFVEINGRAVGGNGIVFLNAPSEYIYLRTLLLSGANLELETRMKPVEFKDIALDADGRTLRVRAEGAEPVDPSQVKKISDSEWETSLRLDRPFTYLKGEGDLPLRQEFLITGPVRKDTLHVYVTSKPQTETYSSHVTLGLQTLAENSLSPYDRRTTLNKLSESDYEWTLSDLEKNSANRRYLKVTSPEGVFVGAYDVHRSLSLDGELRLMLPLWAQFRLQGTLNRRFSSYLSYDQQMVKKSSEPDVKLITVGFQYRMPAGIHLEDAAFGPSLDVTAFQNDIKSVLLMNAGLFAEFHSPAWYRQWLPWTILRAKMPVTIMDADYKLKSSWDAEIDLRHFFSPTAYFEFGLRHQQLSLQSNDDVVHPPIKSSKALILVGLGALF